MKKPPLIIRFLLSVVSFVLCVCLFVAAIAAILIADVRALTGKETLQKLISDLMFTPMASRQIPAAAPQLFSLHQIRLNSEPVAETQDVGPVVEWVYSFLQEQLGEEFDLTYDHVNAFFEESTAKDFLSEKIAAVISDTITGEQTTSITNEEIAALIAENKDLIEKHFGVAITEEQMQNLTNWVEETGLTQKLSQEGIATMLGSASEGGSEPVCTGVASVKYVFDAIASGEKLHIPTTLAAARFIISDTVMYTILGICILLIGLLVAANLIQIHKGLISGGVTLLLAGVIMVIPALLSSTLVGAGFLPGALQKLVQHMLNTTMPAALVTLGAAVALLAGGITLACVLPKRKALA